MLLALLLSLVPAVAQGDGPDRITVTINHEQFSRGDHARVYVQTEHDGYVVVLRADAAGRVRVLYPLDPTDDAFVRGGRRQEIRGRADRDAFIVDDDDGAGTVLAAISGDAFNFDSFELNGHWDYRALGRGTIKDDALAGLLDIVQQMSGAAQFDYDAATYVTNQRIANGYYDHPYGYGYPRFGIGLSFGYPYRLGYAYNPFYDPFCYDPFWSWSASCYGFGYGYPYGFGVGLRYGYGYYPRRPFGYRTFGGDLASRGGGGPHFVIPPNRERYTPVVARPRSGAVSAPAPRPWSGSGRSSIAPRDRGASGGSGRPSVSRGGSGGGSRPAARPSGGGRSGSSGRSGGGGRRH